MTNFESKNTHKQIDRGSRSKVSFIQPKPTINQPGDTYDQEADARAERAMRMTDPAQNLSSSPIHTLQRKCSHCEEEDKLRRKESGTMPSTASSSVHQTLNNSGQPLPAESRAFFEPRFRQDFSGVRIHTDSNAAQSARQINALAYTSEQNVVFGSGQFQPETDSGKHLLAHELTHVVQQRKDSIALSKVMREPSSDSSPRLRIPSFEIASMQFGSLGRNRYSLSSAQVATGREIFGNSIMYSSVRVVESSLIAAPTTLGNNIRIPPGDTLDNATLIHELTHVWQFQNHGTSYISDSLVNQAIGIITAGDRNAAYVYKIVSGKPFSNYSAEHQAMIVQDYYSEPALRSDPEYMRLLAEVRSASPTTMTDLDRYGEALYGPAYPNSIPGDPFNTTGSGIHTGGEAAPLLRLEFDW